LLDLTPDEITEYQRAVVRGDRREIPGAVRASAGLSTSAADVDRLLAAMEEIVTGDGAPIAYTQDLAGDFAPAEPVPGWPTDEGAAGGPCASG
jgi:hypothetical protein